MYGSIKEGVNNFFKNLHFEIEKWLQTRYWCIREYTFGNQDLKHTRVTGQTGPSLFFFLTYDIPFWLVTLELYLPITTFSSLQLQLHSNSQRQEETTAEHDDGNTACP